MGDIPSVPTPLVPAPAVPANPLIKNGTLVNAIVNSPAVKNVVGAIKSIVSGAAVAYVGSLTSHPGPIEISGIVVALLGSAQSYFQHQQDKAQ